MRPSLLQFSLALLVLHGCGTGPGEPAPPPPPPAPPAPGFHVLPSEVVPLAPDDTVRFHAVADSNGSEVAVLWRVGPEAPYGYISESGLFHACISPGIGNTRIRALLSTDTSRIAYGTVAVGRSGVAIPFIRSISTLPDHSPARIDSIVGRVEVELPVAKYAFACTRPSGVRLELGSGTSTSVIASKDFDPPPDFGFTLFLEWDSRTAPNGSYQLRYIVLREGQAFALSASLPVTVRNP